MRRTGPLDLLIAFLLLGGVTYLALRAYYDSMPPLQALVALPLFALAIVEFEIARRVRLAVRHDPNARPMHAIVDRPLRRARQGVGAGRRRGRRCRDGALLLRVLPHAQQVRAAGNDSRVGTLALAAALLLLAAGLVLERAGVDPGVIGASAPKAAPTDDDRSLR